MSRGRLLSRSTACLLLAIGVAALAADDAKSKSAAVEMKSKRYEPAKLTIKAGQTVKWTNSDDHDHTVIAEDKSFKSDNISPGDTFEFTFKKAGTFKYGCKYHPRMKGSIAVEK